MIVEVKVNELPESVADGTLVAWHKQPGERDQGRRRPGRDRDRQGRAGNRRAQRRHCSASNCARRATRSSAATSSPPSTPPARRGQVGRRRSPRPEDRPAAKAAARPSKKSSPARAHSPPQRCARRGLAAATATPAAEPHGDDRRRKPWPRPCADFSKSTSSARRTSPASGPRGRITKEDVLRHLEHSPQLASNIGEAPTVVELSEARDARRRQRGSASRPTTRTKMTRLRARIAERMLEAQR